MSDQPKTAWVYKHRTGWWAVKDNVTGQRVGGLFETELEAMKYANAQGYICE